jgi:hypothetical protein
MREHETTTERQEALEIGAATELTQGSYLPGAFESLIIRDHWDDEP